MKIGFDLDGVLAITDEAMMAGYHARGLCQDYTEAHITDFYLERCIPGACPKVLQEILNAPGFYRELAPCAHLVEAARTLGLQGHELHIVTARVGPPHVEQETRAWLQLHQIPFAHLEIKEAKDKHTYVEKHGLEFFVEDRFDTANQIAQLVPVLLVETPYNTPHAHGRGALHPNVLRGSREELRRTLRFLHTGAERYRALTV